jgi:predicted nucleotidyltransferase
MRLSPQDADAIRSAARSCFGPTARVWLFGSRADDRRSGGDIDLLVDCDLNGWDSVLAAERRFLAELERTIGERRVHVVIDFVGRESRPPILSVARQTGLPL